MTFLTMEGSPSHVRRHALRQRDPVAGGKGAVWGTPLQPPAAVQREARAGRRTAVEIGAVALLVLALHAGLVALGRARHDTSARVVPPKPLPMTVELTRPPVPLPQAKLAPPPAQPPRPARQVPQPKPSTRTPAARPTPVAVQPTPAPPQTATPADAVVAHAPAPAPPAPAVAPSAVVESAPIGNAAYLHNPAPDYPPVAHDQGWEGRVLLRVHVLANGKPDSVDIKTGSGRKMLDEAAVAAVSKWSFVPAKRGDEAVDGWVNVPIDFKLG